MIYSDLLTPKPQPKKTSSVTSYTPVSQVLGVSVTKQSSPSKSSSSGGNGGSNNNSIPQAPPGVDVKKDVKLAQQYRVDFSPNGVTNLVTMARNAYNVAWFYKKVNYGEDWDLKKYGDQYQDYGNWHYGVVGSAAGYSEPVLRLGAGFAQQVHNYPLVRGGSDPIATSPSAWFDAVEPNGFSRDQFWIGKGINNFQTKSY